MTTSGTLSESFWSNKDCLGRFLDREVFGKGVKSGHSEGPGGVYRWSGKGLKRCPGQIQPGVPPLSLQVPPRQGSMPDLGHLWVPEGCPRGPGGPQTRVIQGPGHPKDRPLDLSDHPPGTLTDHLVRPPLRLPPASRPAPRPASRQDPGTPIPTLEPYG